jgi:N-methylhydantoinase B
MPATLIQPNQTPFNKVAVDPITLDIIENALRNAREEMDAVLFRTAMSPGIREQHDAFPMIANQEGKMVVGQFGSFIWGFMEGFHGTIEDGDIFLTNDPYAVNGAISHQNDWLTLKPIFLDGRLVAWAAMFGHMTDVGGKVPGSLPTNGGSIYEEGVRIPPTKIYRGNALQKDILELILHNCRLPEWNRADFAAIVAALKLAERRVLEIAVRFGVDTMIVAMGEMLDRNKRAMREIIKMVVPEEKRYFEDYIDDDGMGMGPYKVACTMWREGEVAHFDFTGTDPQSISSVNFFLNEEMFKMFLGAFTINLFDPQILFNDGFYDLVEVFIPEGSILKPKKPAALSCRTHLLGRIFDIMGGLLGQGAPEALNAAGFSDSPHLMYSGFDAKGEWYQLFQIGFGGVPGRPAGDGPDGHSMWPGFTNVPNEFLEAYFPLRIVDYAAIPDSGGPGEHRGGDGIRVGYEFLEPGQISIHDDRWLTYPWGVNGGHPGARSKKLLVRTDGSTELLQSKCDNVTVAKGDRLLFDTWGGGGWGDP